jgi:replicative DNA helicase
MPVVTKPNPADPYEQLELAVIGGLILDREVGGSQAIEDIPEYIFVNKTHKLLFNFLVSHPSCRDVVTIMAELKQEKIKISAKTLIDATSTCKSIALLPNYIKQLIEKRKRQTIYSIIFNSKGELSDSDMQDLNDLTELRPADTLRVVPFEELANVNSFDKRYSQRQKLYKDGYPHPTGLATLDDYLGGCHKREILTICGASSKGKTALATQIGVELARKGAKVIEFQLEMDPEHIVDRIISYEAGIENYKIQYAKAGTEDMTRISEYLGKNDFYKIPFFICDSPNVSLPGIKEIVRQHSPDFIIVDYIQIMRFSEGENQERKIAHFMTGMKALVRERDFGALICSQITTQMDGSLEAKGARAIEETSDRMIILDMKKKDMADKVWPMSLIIKKNRHGPVAVVPLKFYRQKLTFSET